MFEDDRKESMRRLIREHVSSPSLRHIRDGRSIDRLVSDILKVFERHNPMWLKWSEARETLARPAAYCWVPVEALRDHLNRMDGPELSINDVAQRTRLLNEEPYEPSPDEELQEACLAIYQRERSLGTEMPAIIGVLQQYIEDETERRRLAHKALFHARAEEERLAAEDRLRSGADCKWTAIGKSKVVHCRINGRTYRLVPRDDKRFNLIRVATIDDSDGDLLGRYLSRGDATKALQEIAYKPERFG